MFEHLRKFCREPARSSRRTMKARKKWKWKSKESWQKPGTSCVNSSIAIFKKLRQVFWGPWPTSTKRLWRNTPLLMRWWLVYRISCRGHSPDYIVTGHSKQSSRTMSMKSSNNGKSKSTRSRTRLARCRQEQPPSIRIPPFWQTSWRDSTGMSDWHSQLVTRQEAQQHLTLGSSRTHRRPSQWQVPVGTFLHELHHFILSISSRILFFSTISLKSRSLFAA